MKISKTVMLGMLVVSSAVSTADIFTPSHSCTEPYKPFEFKSEFELESFNDDVKAYQRCINDFVDDQNEAIRKHRQAADAAIEEWNRYVQYELE